jgi:predicted aconitase
MPFELSARDRALLGGAESEAAALAMRIVVEMAGVMGAGSLLDVTLAHVDGCLYHGRAGLEFAERLAAGGAHVAVPTTLNVGALDLVHPELYRGDQTTARFARRQMDLYVLMGCRPTWTCAPYQLLERPAFGQHVAWAESNAIVFANSVLGARTNRYGDFLDICAAITGRAPAVGLHLDEERWARVVFRLDAIPDRLLNEDVFYPVLGHLVGKQSGSEIPAISGIPTSVGEDRLRALGAAAASSGSVAMFHAVGVTPEAPTLEIALGGLPPGHSVDVTLAMVRAARDELATAPDGPIGAVCVGTPHASLRGLETLARMTAGVRARVPFFVNVGRDVLADAMARGLVDRLRSAGITFVSDTCTYIAPIIGRVEGPVMTDSAKWAWYAPATIGVEVVFGSLEECVRSSAVGRVLRDEGLWADG